MKQAEFHREIRKLAAQLTKKCPPAATRHLGVVTATASSPASVTINLSGDTSVAIPGVRYMAGYSPTIGDTVAILKQGASLLVLGKLAA